MMRLLCGGIRQVRITAFPSPLLETAAAIPWGSIDVQVEPSGLQYGCLVNRRDGRGDIECSPACVSILEVAISQTFLPKDPFRQFSGKGFLGLPERAAARSALAITSRTS